MLWKTGKGEVALESKFDFAIWVLFRQSDDPRRLLVALSD